MACRIFSNSFSNTKKNGDKPIWREEEQRSALLSATVKLQFHSLTNNLNIKPTETIQHNRSYLFKQTVTECKSTTYYIKPACRDCLKKWRSFAWWLEPEVGKNRAIPLSFHWNIHFIQYLNLSPRISLEVWSHISQISQVLCQHWWHIEILNWLIWFKFKGAVMHWAQKWSVGEKKKKKS